MSWPEGFGRALLLEGRARDLLTAADGEARVLAQSTLRTLAARDRTIEAIESDPPSPGLERLVGQQGGGRLRAAIADVLPEEVERGTPLHLLLDDLAGSTLIAGFAYLRWAGDVPRTDQPSDARRRPMDGVCAGYRPGASSLLPEATPSVIAGNVTPVPPLDDPADPSGWHDIADHPAMAMRRARRIDLWEEPDGALGIDSMFRDSCWDPDGSEVAVHEYELSATADRDGVLTSVTARPRVLPWAECPTAADNARWLVGSPLRSLRREVLQRLRGIDCCTHLNDALRALAEVPVLAAHLGTRPSAS